MLPGYIIEEIKRRERERELLEKRNIECPLPIPREEDEGDAKERDDHGESDVIILDFSI